MSGEVKAQARRVLVPREYVTIDIPMEVAREGITVEPDLRLSLQSQIASAIEQALREYDESRKVSEDDIPF